MAKQVYVHLHPILIDVPDNVYAGLSNDRDAELAKSVCAAIVSGVLAGTEDLAGLVESVAKA